MGMLAESRNSMTATALRLAVVVSGVAYALVLLTAAGGPIARTMPSGGPAGPSSIDPDLLIAYALIGAGAAIGLGGGSRRAGLLAALAGIAWLGRSLAGSADGTDSLRGLGVALGPLLGVTLLALIVTVAPRGVGHRWTIGPVAALLAVALLLSVLRLLTYDPFYDPDCAVLCAHSTPFLDPTPVDRIWLGRGADVIAVIAGVLAALYGIASIRSNGRIRGSRSFVVAGVVLTVAGLAGRAALGLGGTALLDRLGAADGVAETWLAQATSIGGGLLLIGLTWSIIDVLRLRVRMHRVANDIASASAPDTLETRLAEALHDDAVTIGYWLSDEARYIGADGDPFVDQPFGSGRSLTSIERDGKAVAVISHRAGLEGTAVTAEVTPSMLVALDNERLQAVSLANLRSLRASRARIVTVEEEERRRVERDLHDGAQQRMLAIAFHMRLARLTAERVGEGGRAERLGRAEALALTAVEGLRRLARGIHPAILSQAGLAPALASLAEEAPIAMTVSMHGEVRLPATIEAAVYQLVIDALSDAVRLGAGELSVTIVPDPVTVAVEIDHDGDPSPLLPLRLTDRVAAAGGALAVDAGIDGSGRRIRAALPCA